MIVSCRLGHSHEYDIVAGPMANDTIFNYVQNFADGKISRTAFWELARFRRPAHQISFHTARALTTLPFMKGSEILDEEEQRIILYLQSDRVYRAGTKIKALRSGAFLGNKTIKRIYKYADVFHCEPIVKTADDFITSLDIPKGDFDNEASCRYNVPDYWTIGEVYERLIEDISGDDEAHIIDRLMEVYTSWIDDSISNYNTDFYYQPREYISICYREGETCP